jgi:hypothetical protein
MLDLAGDDYDFVLGTGWVSFMDPDSPWGRILSKSNLHQDIPLTFLIQHSLWETLGGIPDVPYCHMDHLAQRLMQRGISFAKVSKMCHHHVDGDLWEVVKYYYMSAYSYARSGLDTPEVQLAKSYTKDHLAQLLSALFTSAHAIGAMEGLDLLPDAPLDVTGFSLHWGDES